MATSFGEGAPDVGGVLRNPWVLGAAGVAVLVGIIAWRKTGNQAAPQAPVAASGSGLPGAGVSGVDQLGLQTGGLEGQLANLTGLINANLGANNVPPAANSVAAPAGSIAGQDQGWFYGPLPKYDPGQFHVTWRYTSGFLANHPQFSGQPAAGYGPPAGQPAPEYSWEYMLVPNG